MNNPMTILFLRSIGETLWMVGASAALAALAGLPLGVLLLISQPGHLAPRSALNRVLNIVVNITRSLPFIILMVFIAPITKLLTGSSIGTNATIVPLVVAATPFFARLVETALQEVPSGLVEAARSMGCTTFQTISRVLIPEALPALILALTNMIINLIAYSAMAGSIGGGGLGAVAIQYGYYRYDFGVMFATVVMLIVLVQCVQWIGNRCSQSVRHLK